jgi:hypothetical protein
MHRPHVEVVGTGLDTLEEEVGRFDPHLVICSRPNTVHPGSRPAWIELPLEPDQLAEFCLDGKRSEATNPALGELLQAIDEIEKLALTKSELGDC